LFKDTLSKFQYKIADSDAHVLFWSITSTM